MNPPDKAGTTVKLTEDLTVVLGTLTRVHPVSGYGYTAPVGAPTSGAIPLADGATPATVIGVYVGGVPSRAWANLMLMAPGKANDLRIIAVPAETVATRQIVGGARLAPGEIEDLRFALARSADDSDAKGAPMQAERFRALARKLTGAR